MARTLQRMALAMSAALALLTGCAGFEHKNIVTDEDDKAAEGFRYYETAPFLLVYSDSKGGLTSEVLYLPDYTKKRSIQPYAYAASNKATLKFDKGRLAQAKAVVDETIVPSAIIGSLEKIATSTIKAANARDEVKNTLPGPYLFRIHKSGDGVWTLGGGQALKADGKTLSRVEYLP